MKKHTATFWTYMLGTRPTWGMIPVRIAFGSVCILEALRHLIGIDPTLPAVWIAMIVIEFLAGALAIPGLLTRFLGLAILIESAISIFFDHAPNVVGADLSARILLIGVAALLFTSGAGRHSVDHALTIKLLKKYPNKKKELYSIAEMPLCKWWE